MSNPEAGFDLHVSEAFVSQARSLLVTEYLPKIERCLEALTEEDLWWRANESSNSIGNLLLHLSGNARQWIVSGLGGRPDERRRQIEFDERSSILKADLIGGLKQTLVEVDAVLAGFDLASLLTHYQIQECEVSAIEAVFHVVEHFSMHTGQIILLTKLLTQRDLRFYDFSTGAPVHTWHGPRSSSD
jgi:uncharacterized damage-inducible protein DinB